MGVLEKRYPGRAALLRAPGDYAVLVDVEITRTGAATPFILAAVDEIVLEPVPTRVRASTLALDLFVDLFFAGRQALEEAVSVVNRIGGERWPVTARNRILTI